MRQYLPEGGEGEEMKCAFKKTLMDVKEVRTVWRERKVKGKDLNKKSVQRLIFVKPGKNQERVTIMTIMNSIFSHGHGLVLLENAMYVTHL